MYLNDMVSNICQSKTYVDLYYLTFTNVHLRDIRVYIFYINYIWNEKRKNKNKNKNNMKKYIKAKDLFYDVILLN